MPESAVTALSADAPKAVPPGALPFVFGVVLFLPCCVANMLKLSFPRPLTTLADGPAPMKVIDVANFDVVME